MSWSELPIAELNRLYAAHKRVGREMLREILKREHQIKTSRDLAKKVLNASAAEIDASLRANQTKGT